MKNYNHFDVEDFVCDDAFIQWCLQPSKESIAFWNEWMKQHPHQRTTIEIAAQIVKDLHTIEQEKQEENYEQDIWNKIENNIKPTTKTVRIQHHGRFLKIAAAIIFLIGSFFIYKNVNTNIETSPAIVLQWKTFDNNSSISKTITLSDNSTVVLEPFSTLKYPTIFSEKQREVLLTGEAFFDIARDTSKPFVVYANETITKVLGTSFTIKAFEGEKTVEVDVKSGKVAVYAQVASEKKETPNKNFLIETDKKVLIPVPNKKLVVTPNQKVVFDLKEEEMIKTVTKTPRRLTELKELPQFQFDNESIIKVFEALELVYGIDIEYDAEKLKHCTITTDLRDEPLFEKLNIISMALGLKVKENDATIFITGSGC